MSTKHGERAPAPYQYKIRTNAADRSEDIKFAHAQVILRRGTPIQACVVYPADGTGIDGHPVHRGDPVPGMTVTISSDGAITWPEASRPVNSEVAREFAGVIRWAASLIDTAVGRLAGLTA